MGFSGGTSDLPAYYEAYLGSERQFRKEGGWRKKKIHKFCTPALNLGNETDFDTDLFLGNGSDIEGN